MQSLKKKFGKFAVSTEKMAKVNGGDLACYSRDQYRRLNVIMTGSAFECLLACQGDGDCVGCW